MEVDRKGWGVVRSFSLPQVDRSPYTDSAQLTTPISPPLTHSPPAHVVYLYTTKPKLLRRRRARLYCKEHTFDLDFRCETIEVAISALAVVGGRTDTSPEVERAWFTGFAIALERQRGLRVNLNLTCERPVQREGGLPSPGGSPGIAIHPSPTAIPPARAVQPHATWPATFPLIPMVRNISTPDTFVDDDRLSSSIYNERKPRFTYSVPKGPLSTSVVLFQARWWLLEPRKLALEDSRRVRPMSVISYIVCEFPIS